MAIVNNGTQNSLLAAQLPSGYTRPTVTNITDYHYRYELTLSVLKSTVENSTAATTMTNIITNGTIGITQQIDDILAADYLASATVTAYTDWIGISHNLANILGSGNYLKDTAMSYTCTVVLYVKAV